MNHLVFADPSNTDARELQADAFEQLGYQTESATFRNAYLSGAHELRNGLMPRAAARRSSYLSAMSVDQVVDSMAVRLKAEEVGGQRVLVNLTIHDNDIHDNDTHDNDAGERWVLGLSDRALHHVRGRHDPAAAVTLTMTKATLLAAAEATTTLANAVRAGDAVALGDLAAAALIFDHLDVFFTNFSLAEP